MLSALPSFAQIKNKGVPLVYNYSPSDYHEGNQNWAIIQDDRGIMYFGNSQGILEFDGVNWKKISDVAAIAFVKDSAGTIFVGGRQDFGLLEPDSLGYMQYTSLVEITPDKFIPKRNFWSVGFYENSVLFSCENQRLYIYDGKRISVTDSIWGIGTLANCYGNLYIETATGLGIWNNYEIEPLPGSELLKWKNIRNVFEFGGDSLLIVSRLNGLYVYDGLEIQPWDNEVSRFAIKNQAYMATKISENYYAIGTIQEGVVVFSRSGHILQHVNSTGGMINHDHCAIFADRSGNVWSGLEYGICLTELNTPWSRYNKQNHLTNAAVYSLVMKGGNLYAGLAVGAYYMPWRDRDFQEGIENAFSPIEKIQGRKVWDMLPVDDEIITTSSNVGSFSIQGTEGHEITSYYAPKDIRFFRKQNKLVCAGEHNGIFTYGKDKGEWTFIKQFKDFNFCTSIEIDTAGYTWLVDEGKLYRILFNTNYDTIIEKVNYDSTNSRLPDAYYTVLKLDDRILVNANGLFYQYQSGENNFELFDAFNKFFPEGSYISKFSKDIDGKTWFWGSLNETEEMIGQIHYNNGQIYSVEIIKKPLRKLEDAVNLAFLPIDEHNILFGSSNQIYHFDANFQESTSKLSTLIRKVEYISSSDSVIFNGIFLNDQGRVVSFQPESEVKQFKTNENSLRFSYSALSFIDQQKVKYSYKLENFDAEWSDWSFKTEKDYTNLSPGDYVFKVKAQNIYGKESNIAVYKFHIIAPPKPWYLTTAAFSGYVILLGLLILGIVKLSIRQVEMKNKKLEMIVQQRTEEVVQQKNDIVAKNAVLQQQKEEILTQNEVLNQQKEEIEAQRDEIEQQRDLVIVQKDQIQYQNQEIKDSISYASRIQMALLPSEENLSKICEDYFVLFKPRDVVSGDFYWASEVNGWFISIVADCTGHGVPGAMMSMLGISFINDIVRKQEVNSSSEVLNLLRKDIIESLQQHGEQGETKDGMDMSVCAVNLETNQAQYAGANNSMYLIKKENNEPQLVEFKPDKMPVAIHTRMQPFTDHNFTVEKGDKIYLFTDGFPDQFGGPKGKKIKYRAFKELVLSISDQEMKDQKKALNDYLANWMGESKPSAGVYEQIDDICVLGFQLI